MGKQLVWATQTAKRYTPPVTFMNVVATDNKTGTVATVHNLTSVPAGALLVLLTGNQNSNGNATVTSSPSLTWTKRADVQDPARPNTEIWTAVYTAGGSIDVTSDWGATRQSSTVVVITGQEATLAGATITTVAQAAPNATFTTTAPGSLIIANTTNWNAITGTRTYRGTPEELYYTAHAESSFFRYYYQATAAMDYNIGFTAPNDVDAGSATAAIEIRSGDTPRDTTPPSTPTLSSPGKGSTSINLSWTAATDNSGGVISYKVYRDGALVATTTSLTFNNTGLTASTSYDFYVRATDPSGNYAQTSTLTVSTNAAPGGGSGATDFDTLTFTALSTTYSKPFGGSFLWNENSGAQIVSGVDEPLCDYRRFAWTDIEENTLGNYQWAKFDSKVQNAINAGHTFAFGIMADYPDPDLGGFNRVEDFGSGRYGAYPTYVHTYMQGEATKDFINISGDWTLNPNSTYYVTRLRALHAAVYAHILATSYVATAGPHDGETIQFADVIEYVDVRGFGAYGEWHHNGIVAPYPAYADAEYGARWPNAAKMKEIIDCTVDEFPDWPLCIIFNTFDHMVFRNTRIPNEVGVYAMTVTNTWGKLGYRNDHEGDDMDYDRQIQEDNYEEFSPGVPMRDVIMERWRESPIIGEPPGYGAPSDCGHHMCKFPYQAELYHKCYIGNGNYGGNPTGSTITTMRTAFAFMGHLVRLTAGTMTLGTTTFDIELTWQNFGNTPPYDKSWEVTFELRTFLLGTVVWDAVSDMNLYGFHDDGAPDTITDNYSRPAIADGTYKLCLIIRDTRNGYRQPFPLGINGRQSDGSYYLCDVTFIAT